MASLRGPRRTRVYDANYNIGQSYYKPALDNLDRKYYGKPETSTFDFPSSRPRTAFNLDDRFDEDLTSARQRASKAIQEESLFDSRGARASRGAPISSVFDDDIDEDVKNSLSRIRASKSKIQAVINDFADADDSFTTVKRRSKLGAASSLLDDADEDFGSSIRSRRLKSRVEEVDEPVSATSVSSFKRLAITDSSESSSSAAAMRAQATKARLADIETDMFERSEKLAEREKRAANLKKILAENDIEAVSSSSTKHVSF